MGVLGGASLEMAIVAIGGRFMGVGVGFFLAGRERGGREFNGTQVNVLRLRQCKTRKGTRSCVRLNNLSKRIPHGEILKVPNRNKGPGTYCKRSLSKQSKVLISRDTKGGQ